VLYFAVGKKSCSNTPHDALGCGMLVLKAHHFAIMAVQYIVNSGLINNKVLQQNFTIIKSNEFAICCALSWLIGSPKLSSDLNASV